MKMYQTTICPSTAAELLTRNTRNRPANRAHIKRLAVDMAAGRWKLNGEAIKTNGAALLDGQHRLEACVLSGKPFETFMVEGVASDAFDTIDTGKRRSPGDTLYVLGYKNVNVLASTLILIEKYHLARMSGQLQVSNIDIEYLVIKYPNAKRSSQFASNKRSRLLTASIVGLLHYLFTEADEAIAGEFIDGVLTGADLSSSDPAYILRERLVDNQLSNRKYSKEFIAAISIKAWNAFRCGKVIKQLKYIESEDFPAVK